ncbi:SKP1-like protein 20 [Rutidosis leptorrhynchoides]|uniref:SKP1-like protein 20 n=1 Tax=Rutidosis leptorrhynchoides TaxID=125765 RepID=UPI003A99BAC9
MAVVKPEMKSFIWLEIPDGSVQQVEEEVAMFCPMICRQVLQTGMGSSKNYAIKLPQRVYPAVLGLVLDYCRFHQVPGHSNKERKTFDEKFIRLNANQLCDLASAADSLRLSPLVDLTCRAIARMIQGKTAEQIRETFHIVDDLTEEEKLEPLKIRTNDPRVRLLNRLYAKKRKQLKARKDAINAEIKVEGVDDRSVDDLLVFINSGNEDINKGGVKSSKNKKKNRKRRKDHLEVPPLKNIDHGNHNKETDSLSSSHNSEIEEVISPSTISNLVEFGYPTHTSCDFDFDVEDDDDDDDDLDPALREQLDREVEDFARRLNSIWPERKSAAAAGDHHLYGS